MDKSDIPGSFKGSIEDLLQHCETLNIEDNQKNINDIEKEECFEYIMKEFSVDREQAQEIYDEISLIETKNTVDQMVDDGLLEVSGLNEDGEPLFVLTELGKKIHEELKKNQ
jgi:ERCC4-related helicase